MGSELRQPELDARDAVRHLARHELEPAPRRLVVEQHARHREEVVALAVVHGDVMREHLRHAVRAARVERRHLGLRHFAHLAEHLARRGLIEADGRVDAADGVEHPRDALRVELAGEHRLIPRRRHERHGREVVDLVRPHIVDESKERQLVEQVGVPQRDAVEQVLDAPACSARSGAAPCRTPRSPSRAAARRGTTRPVR